MLLCHGVAGNARHMDLDDQHSLARYLAARGFDAWVLSLRGTGQQFFPADSATQGAPDDNTTIDTYASQDLPAAIAEVKKRTHAPRVSVIAHSMGGMVTYAHLALTGGPDLASIVTLGSPGKLRLGAKAEKFIVENGSGIASKVLLVPNADIGRVAGKTEGVGARSAVDVLAGNPPENTSFESLGRLLRVGSADTPGGVVRQFQRCLAADSFVSADGATDYLPLLAKVKVPALVVAGKDDRIVLADGVKAGYEALGGEKELLVIGEESGARADYGHADLIIGDRAPTEVWAKVAWFLGAHDAQAPAGAP